MFCEGSNFFDILPLEWFDAQVFRPMARFFDPADGQTYDFLGRFAGHDRYLFRETYQKTDKDKVYYELTKKQLIKDVEMNKYVVTEVLDKYHQLRPASSSTPGQSPVCGKRKAGKSFVDQGGTCRS